MQLNQGLQNNKNTFPFIFLLAGSFSCIEFCPVASVAGHCGHLPVTTCMSCLRFVNTSTANLLYCFNRQWLQYDDGPFPLFFIESYVQLLKLQIKSGHRCLTVTKVKTQRSTITQDSSPAAAVLLLHPCYPRGIYSHGTENKKPQILCVFTQLGVVFITQ